MNASPPVTNRAQWRERNVDAGGVTIHLRELPCDGPPVLLLHGLGASGAVWQSFARRLHPWTVLAPDLRGHGLSDQPLAGYSPHDYAKDLVALLDALGIERLPVIGHSLGALVALRLAALAPPRVKALVLLDPPLDPRGARGNVAEVYRLRHAPQGVLEAYLASDSSELIARGLAAIFHAAADQVFEEYLGEPVGAPWAWEAAPGIAVPVLIVQADPANGGALGDGAARRFVAALPQGRLVFLPGAQHALHASHPVETAVAITEFLGSGG